jgi:MarR family transcriptional regulator, lower aerobic nicotinate degradation pathway regulator
MGEVDDGRIVSALSRLAATTRREFGARIRVEPWAQEAGLRPGAYGTLQIVRARQPISQRALSDIAGMDPADIVAIVDILERAGYVTRARDEDDRRRRNLTLTPAGAAATERLDRIATETIDAVFARLTRRERAVVDRLLAKAAFGPREP